MRERIGVAVQPFNESKYKGRKGFISSNLVCTLDSSNFHIFYFVVSYCIIERIRNLIFLGAVNLPSYYNFDVKYDSFWRAMR